MVGLVPTIQLSPHSDACREMDPRDKPRAVRFNTV
jgi:hypothetical protein